MRRLFWVAFGIGAGVAGAVMTQRFLRRQTAKVAPANLTRQARGGMMDLAKLVSESIAEGREEMQRREEELRSGIGSS
ncbi:MAG TPA: hypothetical protein VIC58_02210 [Actinomycetota bacterium]